MTYSPCQHENEPGQLSLVFCRYFFTAWRKLTASVSSLVHGPDQISWYHFRGEIVTCTNLKTNSSCLRIFMIALLNGQLHYIFLELKIVENSAISKPDLTEKKVLEKKR